MNKLEIDSYQTDTETYIETKRQEMIEKTIKEFSQLRERILEDELVELGWVKAEQPQKEIAELKLQIHQLELRYLNQQNMIRSYIKELEDINRSKNEK